MYCHSMVISSFCVIKLYYLGNYHGMAVNYHVLNCFITVANAMFSLLKLLIYEPLLFALVGWSARPRLEPSRAIGTLEPFLGHLALG